MKVNGKYFYGNEVSAYGQEHNRVDYATLAKSFDAVLNNDIMNKTYDIGYWEPITSDTYYEDYKGNIYTQEERDEKLEELEERKEELEESIENIQEEIENITDEETNDGILSELKRDLAGTENALADVNEDIEALNEEHYHEIYQWYIVDNTGAEILEEINEVLYYNEELDIYLWGVTHWGTSWDYVLTNIECNAAENE